MRTKDRLTFYLVIQENCSEVVTRYQVHPSYDKLQLSYTKESDKVYYNPKVVCTFALHGQECMLVQTQSLLAKMTLEIYDRGEMVASGTFRKTDCNTDMNHEVVEFEINANDMYDELESNNSEYNMIKWGLEKHSLDIKIKPVTQVYSIEDSKMFEISNRLSVRTSNIEEGVSDESALHSDYGYNVVTYGALFVNGSAAYSGKYMWSGSPFAAATQDKIASNGNGWYAAMRQAEEDRYYMYLMNNPVYDDATIRYKLDEGWYGGAFSKAQMLQHDKFRFGNETTIVAVGSAKFVTAAFRLATDVSDGFCSPINAEDFYDTRHLYTSNLTTASIVLSGNTSNEDNGYKQYEEGVWYAPPSEGNYCPFMESKWFNGISFWLSAILTESLENHYTLQSTIRDWYTLGDLIKGLIGQIDPSLAFESDTDHSQFLFASTNPVSGEEQNTYYVTQKSNLLNYRYEYPAWSALITWNRLETMLRCLFNCYYDIYVDADGAKHLRIEHINFYNNGCSYEDDPRKRVDLTIISDTNNRKPMSFLTDRWKYDTNRPYSRWEFSWMDTQSEPFDAFPIQVPKRYMIYSRNTIDTRNVDWFSADIDFLLSAQQEASSDGFMIVMDDGDGNIHQGNVTIGGTIYYCQNDRLALRYLQKAYLLTDIYSPYVNIDNTEELTETMEGTQKRMRLQDVEFGMPSMSYPRPEYLYKTEIGLGTIDMITIDLTDMHCTATIRHNNETIE